MRNKKFFFSFLVIVCLLIFYKQEVFADYSYYNQSTSYEAYIDDYAELLSNSEKEDLLDLMSSMTEYGNMVFVTIDYNLQSTDSFARRHLHDRCGEDDGLIFVIDMDAREIYLYTEDSVHTIIPNRLCLSITDNIYTYATDGDYGKCAYEAFSEAKTLLEGGKISQPMRHIGNVLFALILALIINYFVVRATSSNKKVTSQDLLEAIKYHCTIHNPTAQFTYETKQYSPQSSGSGHSGGGHGGGGGHSGGGGGHHF